MTQSNEKAAGGGAVERRTWIEIWDNPLVPLEERLAICDGAVDFYRRVADHQRQLKTDAESALKLQADRIAELEGVLRALRRSHDADSHGHGLTVAQLLTIDDALAKTA